MLKVLLAGGGTAGHLNPALAIAEIIKAERPDTEFLFAGTPFGIEAKLLAKTNYAFAPIKVKGFQRDFSLESIGKNFQAAFYLTTVGFRAAQIIKQFSPDIVIGTGGYVSGPIVMKAASMKIPTAIHEQNAYPGVTTRLLSKCADAVMLTVDEAAGYLDKDIKYTVTGLPVRSCITSKTKAQARAELGFDDSLCILSFGGSGGAGGINDAATELFAWHAASGHDGAKKINHIHGYGGAGKETFLPILKARGVQLPNKRLIIKEYIDNMDTCMAAADLVICRSGANTLTELETLGRASILIPSPVVAGNHQYYNAKVLEDAGAAFIIEQKDLTPEVIISKVWDFYDHPEKLEHFGNKARGLAIKDTNERIYKVISKLLPKI